MKTQIHLVIVFVFLAFAPTGCASSNDIEMLQGSWKIQKMAGDFTFDLPLYKFDEDLILSFRDNTFSFMTSKESGKVIKGTFKIDASKDPKTVTFSFGKRNVEAIWTLSRDRLQICVGPDDNTAPTEFKGGPDSRPALLELKRLTPE